MRQIASGNSGGEIRLIANLLSVSFGANISFSFTINYAMKITGFDIAAFSLPTASGGVTDKRKQQCIFK
ncbi:hypothetical protein L2D01_03685 [Hyphomonadaceae bacterium ML37]|nr:hypothetical protein L2D01_03685 [Hyphomonadaceae bacterium ML37]